MTDTDRRAWIDERIAILLTYDKPMSYFEAMKLAAKEYNDKFVDVQKGLF